MARSSSNSMSSQIHQSRDQIRNQIVEYMKSYLELENIDLTKSSFLSFLINVISTLTGNLMFYQSSVYKEFFLTTAQLPESIFNLSAFLGYKPQNASYATTDCLLTFPLSFEEPSITFTIPLGHKFHAGNIQFVTFYETEVTITNNKNVNVIAKTNDNRTFSFPVYVDTTSDMEFRFLMPVRQYKPTVQEFQLDEDIETYQFVTLDVPLKGKMSTIKVEMRDPGGSAWQIYEEFASLYLMTDSDYGFVARRIDNGLRLYFGNGLIGVQPTPGATVRITINETLGADGNVIEGSISNGERIYVNTATGNQLISYNVINTSPASGGADEESIERIRTRAINHLTSLNRLVTENDYKIMEDIIPNTPITSSIPVLKRSDLKCNDIQVYTSLEFNGEIVPTRNGILNLDSSIQYIPRNYVLNINGEDYITLFDMEIDPITNSVAYYTYIIYEISQSPVLVKSYDSVYKLYPNEVIVKKDGNKAIFELHYLEDEISYPSTTCELMIVETGNKYNMINDSANKKFVYEFSPYTILPEGEATYQFTISSPSQTVSTYSCQLTFRQSLNKFMMSNVFYDSTSNITTIYDVPVVKKSYYENIDKKQFESKILQTLLETLDFENYRMLTDFTNLKLTNTTGKIENMQYNKVTRESVIDCDLHSVPVGNLNDRYIVSGFEGGTWEGKQNMIAKCIDETSQTWFFIQPVLDDIVYVTNKGLKYIFAGNKWIVPNYNIPLELEIEVVRRQDYTDNDTTLRNAIIETLLNEFQDRFGSNITLFTSEIIDVIQGIEGVHHCNVIKPESNIFFDFDLQKFKEQELLKYTPEYVYFKEDNITIRIFSH